MIKDKCIWKILYKLELKFLSMMTHYKAKQIQPPSKLKHQNKKNEYRITISDWRKTHYALRIKNY